MGSNSRGAVGAVLTGILLASLAEVARPNWMAGKFLLVTLIASLAVYFSQPTRLARRRIRRPAFPDILPPQRRRPRAEVTRDQLAAYFERISDSSGS